MKRLTIATLVSNMGGYYHENIVTAVEDYCKEHDINHLGFAGGPFKSPDNTLESRSHIYEIINKNEIDGFVIPVSSLCRFLSKQETLDFVASFAPVPIVSIGGSITGVPNVSPDYGPGIKDLIRHFIVEHGSREFAFIRGSAQHASSNIREQALREVLAEAGLPIREERILVADLSRTGGIAIAEKLFSTKIPKPDTIISINDLVLLGMLDWMSRQDIRVPDDVRVASTQGAPDSAFASPPLTIVRENDYNMARRAAEAIVEMIGGKTQPEQIYTPTDMVIRYSCGCQANSHRGAGNNPLSVEPEPDGFLYFLKTNLSSIIQGLARTIREKTENRPHGLSLEVIKKVVIAFVESFEDKNPELFRTKVTQLSGFLSGLDGNNAVFSFLNSLHDLSIHHLRRSEDLQLFDSIWTSARCILESSKEQLINFPDFLNRKHINFLREITHYLGANFDMSGLVKVFNNYGAINECYVCLYEYDYGAVNNIVSPKSRLIYAYHDWQNVAIPAGQAVFPTSKLLPDFIKQREGRFGFFIEPLNFSTTQIGYIIFDFNTDLPGVLETVQGQFSSVLNNTLQIQALHEAEERFSDIAFSTSDWLWETDHTNCFTYCSEGVIKVLGYTAQEMLGHSLFDFLQTGEHEYKNTLLNDIIPNHKPILNLESWNNHKNGYVIGLLISGKPIIRNNLLVGYRGVFKDITLTKQAEDKVRFLAYYDMLTGLPNRTLYYDRLETALLQAQREKKQLAIMFLDLDKFKQVNDTLGHAAGDELLQKVALKLKGCARTSDTLARLGGDEFTVLLPDINGPEDAATLGQRILTSFSAPIELKGSPYRITSSIGISLFPRDGEDSQALLKHADEAMYLAKQGGKNHYVFFDQSVRSEIANRSELEDLLYTAIEKGLLQVHYQPLIDAHSGQVCGFEGLLRLHSPQHGNIPPAVFIPITEEIGLIESYTEWALSTVCQTLENWKAQEIQCPRMAINISRTLFRNNHLPHIVLRTIQRYHMDPALLELEITEQALAVKPADTLHTLSKLQEIGISIAMDDFGTGHSSLSSLQQFPVNTVKIDKSFVMNMTDRQSMVTVETVLFMAKKLNMRVIAEGVESREDMVTLKNLSCDGFQGYYFGKALPFDEATKVARDGTMLAKIT